jgi:hypothetical protein
MLSGVADERRIVDLGRLRPGPAPENLTHLL